jgi:hypothetical protein
MKIRVLQLLGSASTQQLDPHQHDFSGKLTRYLLIPLLFTIMFGFRASASILMYCLAPP